MSEKSHIHIERSLSVPGSKYEEIFNEVLDPSKKMRAMSAGVTPFDFLSLPGDALEKEIWAWASSELGVPQEILMAHPRGDGNDLERKSDVVYHYIRRAFASAIDFLKDVCKLPLPYFDFNPDPSEITSPEQLLKFIRRATLFSGSETKDVDRSRAHCGMLKWALVFYDLQLKDIASAQKEAAFLDMCMSDVVELSNNGEPGFRERNFLPLIKIKGLHAQGVRPITYSTDNGNVVQHGLVTSRAKHLHETAIKIMERPESTSDAIKDVIGQRFTIPEAEATSFLVNYIKWMHAAFGVESFSVENVGFFEGEASTQFEEEMHTNPTLSSLGNAGSSVSITSRKKKAASAGFKNIKCTFEVLLPKNGDLSSREMVRRPVEVQIVSPFNRNEKGKGSHAVYEVARIVSALTRAYGSCEESAFDAIILSVSNGDRDRAKTIKSYLLEEAGGETKIRARSVGRGKRGYIFLHHIKRWRDAGIIDESIAAGIMHDRNALREKRRAAKKS